MANKGDWIESAVMILVIVALIAASVYGHSVVSAGL